MRNMQIKASLALALFGYCAVSYGQSPMRQSGSAAGGVCAPQPVAPLQASASPALFCQPGAGAPLTLTASGGAGDLLEWYVGGCGPQDFGVLVATGVSATISQPGMSATYHARWVNGCGASPCASVPVSVAGGAQLVSQGVKLAKLDEARTVVSLSANGRFVALATDRDNVVPGDTNGIHDIFVYDRLTGSYERVSVGLSGSQSNGVSDFPVLSADGRFVAFVSAASNLVAGEHSGVVEPFVYDRLLGTTERVAIGVNGAAPDGKTTLVSISADGRFVAFDSHASNLIENDSNGVEDVFVRDRFLGVTHRASVTTGGFQADAPSQRPRISSNGRFVSFDSNSELLVENDGNRSSDVFVRDLLLGVTERVSISASGVDYNDPSFESSISSDGRFVTFKSFSNKLVADDTNGHKDVFLRDRLLKTTERVSIGNAWSQSDDWCLSHAVSSDGRYVAFACAGTKLTPGDLNHVDDVFVRDRQLHTTTRISFNPNGQPFSLAAATPAISADARSVAFVVRTEYVSFLNPAMVYDVYVTTLQPSLAILWPPADIGVCVSNDAEFEVFASSTGGDVAYSWRKDGVTLVDGGSVSGAATPKLRIASVTPASAGTYDVVVSNACTSMISSPAALVVLNGACPGDLNGDLAVNDADLGLLLDEFGCFAVASSCKADINCDDWTDDADLALLLNYFSASCEQ